VNFDLSHLNSKWFHLDVAATILPKLIAATGITIYVTVVAFVFALILGLPLLLLRRSRHRFIAFPVASMIEFIRSTPLLVQIYFFFFVLPDYGVVLSPVTTGIVAMSIHYGCYMSEVYRSGLESIPRGQWDATTSLNFSRLSGYRYVILPQMIPRIIPAAGNFLIFMFKDSPLLAAISARELMYVAVQHGMDNFQYLEPITMCGLIFLVLSLSSAAIIRVVEARMGGIWFGRHAYGG
jgi:polar amino acid transport system permease protein